MRFSILLIFCLNFSDVTPMVLVERWPQYAQVLLNVVGAFLIWLEMTLTRI